MSCHLFVEPATNSVVRRSLARDAACHVAASYAELVTQVAGDWGATVVVAPALLPADTTRLADVVRHTCARLVFVSHLTRPAARAVLLQHAKLEPDALLLLPFDGTERIAKALHGGESHSVQLGFLRAIAPNFGPAADSLVPGVLGALLSHSHLDSVKTLAAFCAASPRSVERWFHRIGIVPKRFLVCARFVRARSAFDWGWLPGDAARFSGYSRAQSMWRAVRNELSLDPHAFQAVALAVLIARLLVLLDIHPHTSQRPVALTV